jgi:hypothetical protein
MQPALQRPKLETWAATPPDRPNLKTPMHEWTERLVDQMLTPKAAVVQTRDKPAANAVWAQPRDSPVAARRCQAQQGPGTRQPQRPDTAATTT